MKKGSAKISKYVVWGIVVKIWSRGAVLNIFLNFFVLTALVMKEVSAKM